MPSCVAFTDTERLIGDLAKNQAVLNPTNTIFNAKRLIGCRFDDSNLQSELKHLSFKMINQGGKPHIQIVDCGETKSFVYAPLTHHCI